MDERWSAASDGAEPSEPVPIVRAGCKRFACAVFEKCSDRLKKLHSRMRVGLNETVENPGGLVVLIEDEPAISDMETLYLERGGFRVIVERSGDAGLERIRSLRPVAAVVDIGVPGIDGIEVCRRLRADGDWTPFVFATARDEEVDRLLGLELGADDYLVKPFSPRELVARVKGLLRRAAGTPDAALTQGELRLDPLTRSVTDARGPISLTATEFDLLAALMAQPDRVFSREQLMSSVWGAVSFGGNRTVDVHVAQLRAKLGAAHEIRTVRGVGYAFARPAR